MKIVEDPKYLTSVDDMQEFFEDEGYEHFDCGQGYFQTEAEVIAKIGECYYQVSLEAEVLGNKQDRGDKLYFVDSITSVKYEPINGEVVEEMQRQEIRDKITYHQNMIEKLKGQLV